MKRFLILLYIAVVLLVVGGACAPIEGLDGEEDNLPVLDDDKTTTESVIDNNEINENETQEELETTEESVIPEPETTEVKFVRIKADALNVRKNPGIEYEKLTKIFDGQIYEVLDTKPDSEGLPWYQLETPDNHTGWVSSEYCIPGSTYEELMETETEDQ